MLKISTFVLATVLGTIFIAPAFAIDKGPCDHCTMDEIVVKGDRKKSNSTTKTNNRAIEAPAIFDNFN